MIRNSRFISFSTISICNLSWYIPFYPSPRADVQPFRATDRSPLFFYPRFIDFPGYMKFLDSKPLDNSIAVAVNWSRIYEISSNFHIEVGDLSQDIWNPLPFQFLPICTKVWISPLQSTPMFCIFSTALPQNMMLLCLRLLYLHCIFRGQISVSPTLFLSLFHYISSFSSFSSLLSLSLYLFLLASERLWLFARSQF